MKEKEQFEIGRWHYLKPNLTPDKNGDIVLIHKASFLPLEYYEWGINQNKQAFERYQWCEEDFYEDINYCNIITKDELIKEIDDLISVLFKKGYNDFANEYKDIKNFCKT